MSVKVESHVVGQGTDSAWKHVRSDTLNKYGLHTLAMNVPGGCIAAVMIQDEKGKIGCFNPVFVPNAEVVCEPTFVQDGESTSHGVMYSIVESGKDA